MTRIEFLQQLRQALENDLSGSVVQENVDYYNQYISDEVRKGKSEEEVLQMLGDPWILARTVIDAVDGTDRSTVYEAGGSTYDDFEKGRSTQQESGGQKMHGFGFDTWWKKLLAVLAVIMVIVVIFSIVTGLVRLLAPILIPIIVILIIIQLISGRRR